MSVQLPRPSGHPWDRPVIVTGAAGFIGSHLVDALLDQGATVYGVDDLDPWYDVEQKRANLAPASANPRFRFLQASVTDRSLRSWWHEASTVFHLAGRPGVQDSWGLRFGEYVQRNVTDTNAVLDAALHAGVDRVVLASSSSIYGHQGAADEGRAPRPISPYGVTKLAAEQLAGVYGARGLDVTCLRYFTVFGPRQRPDMAIRRLIEATGSGPAFVRRGSGEQRREFTYVADVVAATLVAAHAPGVVGRSLDVSGGVTASLNDVVGLVEELTERRVDMVSTAGADGDPPTVAADLSAARAELGWEPRWTFTAGLAAQLEWHANDGTRPRWSVPPSPWRADRVVAAGRAPTPARRPQHWRAAPPSRPTSPPSR